MNYAKHLTKRLLSVLMAAALVFTCVPLSVFAKDTSEALPDELLLATLSDLHYYPASLAGSKGDAFYTYTEGSNLVYDDLDAIIDSTLASLAYEAENNGLKYVVITGDLTLNGEYEGNVVLAQKLKEFEAETGLKVYVTNGNHDINNSQAASFANNVKEPARTTTAAEFAGLFADFGYNEAYHTYKSFTAGSEGALTYSVQLEEGYRLIMIDAGRYTADNTSSGENEHDTAGSVSPKLLEWVLAEIADAKENGETPIGFTHWNISEMNYMHEHVLQGFVINDGYMLQEILADAGMNYVFSGHQHVNDLDITYSDSGEPMYSVITPTLTEYPFSFRETLFSYNTDGSLDVDFELLSCDEHSSVKTASGSGTYTSPYNVTGFVKQFAGSNASDYLMRFLKKMLSDSVDEIIKLDGIIPFIEKKMDIDLTKKINSLIYGGLAMNNTNIFTAANIMAFLKDLDSQIMAKYINNIDYTYSVLSKAINNLMTVEVTSVPCTKFISTYGFGDAAKGGSIGDLFLSIMVYMYTGNENISDDPFMLSVLEKSKSVEFVDLIFDSVKKYVVDDVVINEVLAKLEVHLNAFFVDHAAGISDYIQVIYKLLTAAINTGIFKVTSLSELASKLYNLIYGNSSDISYKYLISKVLETGYISYGKSIDEVVNTLLDTYVGDVQKAAIANQLYVICEGLCYDEDTDYGVTYTYSGAEAITPTVEDMQLPSNVTLSFGKDSSNSVIITWYTKYSVTGTDIEIFKKGTSSFTGNATESFKISAVTEEAQFTYPGFDFGTFSLFPYNEKVIKHTITLTGLTPGAAYEYKIGDAKKGFWSEKAEYTPARGSAKAFSFIHVTDNAGVTPGQYALWQKTLEAAMKTDPDADFIVHSGNMTYNADFDNQWTWALDSVSGTLMSLPIMYAAGNNEVKASNAMTEHFTLAADTSEQLTDIGAYYSYDYNNAHFIVLNTNNLAKDGTLSDDQFKWLREDLAASGSDWNILVMHSSVYGDSADSAYIRTQLLYLMENYDIDLILQGDDAVYVRTKLLYNDAPTSYYNVKMKTVSGKQYLTYCDVKAGTIAIISGSAGAYSGSTAPVSDLFQTSKATSLPVFTSVHIDGTTLAVDAYTVDENGKTTVIDSFAIEKEPLKVKTGDIDGDKKVTSADARLALRYAVGLQQLEPLAKLAADVNTDKKITSADARLILRLAVGLDEPDPEYIYYHLSDLDAIDY